MLIPEYHVCYQSNRAEQLDRFQRVYTGVCALFMMADGFASCAASPHYVDWLTERVVQFEGSGSSADAVCREIGRLLSEASPVPGKASVAFVVSERSSYRFTTLGDTRIYRLANRDRTHDNSLAERCVNRGECPPDKLRIHPLRNQLTAWAGGRKGTIPTLQWQVSVCRQDERLLLCTDGFWSQVDDDSIYSLSSAAELKELCERLAGAAGQDDSHDNLTAAMLRYKEGG